MKKTLIYVGAVVGQAALAFGLAVFLIGPALRGDPFPWQKKAETAEEGEEHASADEETTDEHAEGAEEEGHGEEGDEGSSDKKGKKKDKKEKKGEHGEAGAAALVPIDAVIVNVAETQGRRFLKASMTLELDDAAEVETATTRLPILRGAVIDVLSGKNLDELVSPDARGRIRGEILDTLNAKGEPEFKDLFFTEFIVQ